MRRIAVALLLLAGAMPGCAGATAVSQSRTAAAEAVRTERRIVHSVAIAGNLLGTSPGREVYVLLPPSYASRPHRRYPVVYALHGFSSNPGRWIEQLSASTSLQSVFAKGVAEMILVFPDGDNAYGGSFYGRSRVTGDFETFVADELPAFIDRTYRTIPRPQARGLMGHSMGGYGVARIGMLRPGRFGVLYMMSPCCLAPLGTQGLTQAEVARIAAMKAPSDAIGLPFKFTGPLATAAAFAPNPAKPPLFVDLAVSDTGTERPEIMAKRAANAPLAFIDQHVPALRTYRAIGIDVGNADSIVPAATRLHDDLDRYAIANRFEVYAGDHTNRAADRFSQTVLPFFGTYLEKQ